jgi:AraC-like DNA-binding protein
MDFPIKHWAPYPRRHPTAFPVASANFIGAKTEWISTAFSTCNFSFILRGRGEWWRDGCRWLVEAPCVIVQWPGEHLDYGPTPAPAATWDELYVVYPPETKARFEAARLIDLALPVWPIRDVAAVRAQAELLRQLAAAPEPAEVADRVDRVCERMILESWLPPVRRKAPPVGDAATVHAIATELRERLAEPDLVPEQLAARRGWSPSTFRRRWAEVMPESPARALQALRMQAACRLLVESTLPIHQVASQVGFVDEYYFSRRFRLEQGMAPRAYRHAYLLRRT